MFDLENAATTCTAYIPVDIVGAVSVSLRVQREARKFDSWWIESSHKIVVPCCGEPRKKAVITRDLQGCCFTGPR